jgi:uncharacterized membrane protein YbaN (DUF454 family)
VKKIFLIAAGGICLALGAAGLFLPVWPTTPFVLLAAGCFSAYPPVYRRILRIRFFREYIEAWNLGVPISRNTISKSLVWLWLMLFLSMYLVRKPWIYVLLGIIGAAVTVHILTIDRMRKKYIKKGNDTNAGFF